ncbi:hypothetical protein F9U64_19500 [Gracilibacillus oryzae]|uniref:Uncharacterized protein n=1 Tax=Gracilibacillus oryzae TaxID=1672701 RepID=A0A7C8GR13_9BACI|nr:hypothetical protein [Gracilibacillus oryzae]KAB8126636.1 hypothetical protein F9U64_19500 [Gracilibacillus oryzae]
MNNYLNSIFLEAILNDFSEKERLLYKSVIEMEDELAESALTPDQFVNHLRIDSPHKRVAEQYDMTLLDLITILEEMEEEVGRKLEEMFASVKWIDYTKMVYSKTGENNNSKLFYVTFPNT